MSRVMTTINGVEILGIAVSGKTSTVKPVKVPPKPVTSTTKPTTTAPAGIRTPPAAATPTKTTTVAPPKPASSTATPAVTAKVKATQDKATKAASRATATGNKLAKLHPGMSKMLKTAGSTLQSKATKLKAPPAAAATTTKPKTSMMGWEVLGDDVADVDASSTNVDLMASAGDLATQILPYIEQLRAAGQTDLASEGEMIVNSANFLIVDLTQQIQSLRMM